MDKWENSNVREPCKWRTVCIFFAQRSKLEERHWWFSFGRFDYNGADKTRQDYNGA
jgi:hypothetical protein